MMYCEELETISHREKMKDAKRLNYNRLMLLLGLTHESLAVSAQLVNQRAFGRREKKV